MTRHSLNLISTSALTNYMYSGWESLTLWHTFIYSSSSNAYLIILLLETCTSPFYVLRYTIYVPDFGCCCPKFIFHGKLDLNMCSVEFLGGQPLAMNYLILTKWHIALSINIGVLENHWRIVRVLKIVSAICGDLCWLSRLNLCNSFSCYRASLAYTYTDRRKKEEVRR